MIGSLRHSQLRAAGAPTIESELVSDTRLRTGTMWHDFFEQVLRGKPVMFEVQLDPWLPEGWSGRADWIMWSDEYKAFILGDLKTIKGEGIRYIDYQGMKQEHLWQLSAYWYALKTMKLRLVEGFAVLYLPMNGVAGEDVHPILVEGTPLAEDLVLGTMESRWRKTQRYVAQVNSDMLTSTIPLHAVYINEFLAPPQDRELGLRWNKDKWDAKWLPHWSAAYCPYDSVLCDCRDQKTEKVGHYEYRDDPDDNIDAEVLRYVPRKGYEKITPPSLTNKQKEKLIAANTEG